MLQASVLLQSGCALGEGPVWFEARNSCLWVDILEKTIFEYHLHSKILDQHQMPQMVSLIIPAGDHNVIVALQGGIARYHLDNKNFEMISDLDLDWNNIRCNDGICNINGHLWIGTTGIDHADGAGDLYYIDNKLTVQKQLKQLTISNGMALTPDNTQLYHTDSVTQNISCYSVDNSTGKMQFNHVAISIPKSMGIPDGMAMDEEGKLWVALWGGFGVGRFDPQNGKMIAFIQLPVPHVTCCAFIGKNRRTLLITTAKKGLTSEELDQYPLSGHVFIAEVDVVGLKKYDCTL
jgi:sugar lactone lactonase YvrE